MPSASQNSSMSLGELAICKAFLDSHRDYAIDLLSNMEKVRQWHGTDSCPETREGRICTVCELCSADGLLGATEKALISYNDVEKHLQGVHSSFGKTVPSCGASALHSRTLLPKVYPRTGVPSRETLFNSHLAKVIFFSIVTVGDTLRSQHATWQARLQSELAISPSSAQSPEHTNTGLGDVDKIENRDMLPQTYSGPRFVGPGTFLKFTEVPTGSVPGATGTPSPSMLVVYRRCLSSDCPCEANRANAVSNSNLRGTCGSQVASNVPRSPSDSKKTRTFKVINTATQGEGRHTTGSATTNLQHRSRGTSGTSDGLAQTRRNDAQTQKPSTYHDLDSPDARKLDTQKPQNVMLGDHGPSSLISETTLLTKVSRTPESIVDPRLSRLRAQIVRSDETRRVLMEWCRAWTADLQLDPQRKHGTGPEASLTHGSTMKDTREYLYALAHDIETSEPDKSPFMTGQVDETATDGLSRGDGTTVQELRFNSEQEELKGQWLMARRKRCKDKKKCPTLI